MQFRSPGPRVVCGYLHRIMVTDDEHPSIEPQVCRRCLVYKGRGIHAGRRGCILCHLAAQQVASIPIASRISQCLLQACPCLGSMKGLSRGLVTVSQATRGSFFWNRACVGHHLSVSPLHSQGQRCYQEAPPTLCIGGPLGAGMPATSEPKWTRLVADHLVSG